MKFNKKLILIPILFSSLYAYSAQEDIEKGKNYLKQHNTNLAIASFERVLMYEPNNDEVKLYLSKIFEKKNPTLAKQYLDSIKKPNKEVKQKIETLKHTKVELKINLFTKIGTIFDTNINNDTFEHEWIVNSQTVYQNSHQTSALGIYELLSFSPTLKINEFPITNTFTFYNKNVIKYTSHNIQLLKYSPSITQNYSIFNFRHHISGDYIRYGGEHYLNKFSIGETIKFNFFKKNKNTTNIKYSLNKYASSNEKDYSQFDINSKIISQLSNSFNLSTFLGYKNASSDNNYILNDYHSYQMGIGSKIAISKYELALNLNRNIKLYNDTDPLFNKTRSDHSMDYKVSFNSKGYFTYQTQIEYLNNKSNIKPYSYDKWLISLNLIKTFKGL